VQEGSANKNQLVKGQMLQSVRRFVWLSGLLQLADQYSVSLCADAYSQLFEDLVKED